MKYSIDELRDKKEDQTYDRKSARIDPKALSNHIVALQMQTAAFWSSASKMQDDVFYRMGDKSKKLSFDDRLRLLYSKGSRYYEDEPVADSTLDDIDIEFVSSYCRKIGYNRTAEEYITQNKSFVVTKSGRPEKSTLISEKTANSSQLPNFQSSSGRK